MPSSLLAFGCCCYSISTLFSYIFYVYQLLHSISASFLSIHFTLFFVASARSNAFAFHQMNTLLLQLYPFLIFVFVAVVVVSSSFYVLSHFPFVWWLFPFFSASSSNSLIRSNFFSLVSFCVLFFAALVVAIFSMVFWFSYSVMSWLWVWLLLPFRFGLIFSFRHFFCTKFFLYVCNYSHCVCLNSQRAQCT